MSSLALKSWRVCSLDGGASRSIRSSSISSSSFISGFSARGCAAGSSACALSAKSFVRCRVAGTSVS